MASKTLEDILELAILLQPEWAEISEAIPAWHPRNEGDEGDDGSDDGDDADDGSGDDQDGSDDGADGDGNDDEGSRAKGDDLDSWKRNARKHEREAKKLRKERDDLAKAQKEREDAAKSETERAIEAAREEGKTAALTEAEKERRSDRLETAVIRLAARGIKVKDGDSEKTLRFDDPEDALVFIERAITRGDLDADDVFDDNGKVKADAVEEELADLLKRKPRLAASENGDGGGGRRVEGGADGGRGRGGGKGIEDMSTEEHIKRMAQGQK